MAKQEAQTKMTKDWLAGVEQEGAELETKVKRLEMHLNNSVPTSLKELQVTGSSMTLALTRCPTSLSSSLTDVLTTFSCC